jgi:hypothetical protein
VKQGEETETAIETSILAFFTFASFAEKNIHTQRSAFGTRKIKN